MATENRLLRAATELHDHATHNLQASRELADMGWDHEVEARLLQETVAAVRRRSEHLQEKVREPGRRRRPTGAMATENRILKTATELHDQATLLLQAARELAAMGWDHKVEARRLQETVAAVRGWSEHFQEKVRELRRRRPPGESGHSGA
jgi:hypothetical protein